MKISLKLVLFALQYLSFAAIVVAQTPIPENILPQRFVDPENLVHIGDLIDVDFIGSTEFDWRGSMNPEGFLDQIGFSDTPINALCRSEEAVAKDIATLFSKTLRNPTVVVKIIDRSNRSISLILGAVKTPQRFRIKRAVRLNELIILSGGFTEKASGEIQILRPANVSCESAGLAETEIVNVRIPDILRGDISANPTIRVGDIITVKETDTIFVSGGVGNPRRILFRDNMTLSRAIDSAGGIVPKSPLKQITIFRRTGKTTTTILVDYKQILAKKFEDIELKKYDIIFVEIEGERDSVQPIFKSIVEKTTENLILPIRIIE